MRKASTGPIFEVGRGFSEPVLIDMEDEDAFVAEDEVSTVKAADSGGNLASADVSDPGPRRFRTPQSLDMAIEDWDTGFDDDNSDLGADVEARHRLDTPSLDHADDLLDKDEHAGDKEAAQLKKPLSSERQQIVANGDDGDDDHSGGRASTTEKKVVSWKTYGCYISTGGDILGSPRRGMTVQEAKQLCAQTPDCRGFTFYSGTKTAQGRGRSSSSKKRTVHFKSKFDCNGAKEDGWTAHRKVEVEAVVPERFWKQKPLGAPWRKPSLLEARKIRNVTVLSTEPTIWQFDDFLTDIEMASLREAARPMLEETPSPVSAASTAKSVWLSREEDLNNPVLQALEARLGTIIGLPVENQEPAQVLLYGFGDKYALHHDLLESQSRQASGVRVATLLMYLGSEAADQGGETHFPALGLKVVPVPGRAVLWWNVDPSEIEAGMPHKMDRRTVHEALPVQHGEKWAVNKWVHMLDFQTPYFARTLIN